MLREKSPCTVVPGHGLIEHGWCVLKFDYCPVCMEKMTKKSSYVPLDLDMNISDAAYARSTLLLVHPQCMDIPFPDEDISLMQNVVRLFHEFNSEILV